MAFIIEFGVAVVLATIAVALGTKFIGDRGASNYIGMLDREGNASRAYTRPAKYLSLMAGGIAGAMKLPAIINAIAKVVTALTGAQ